MEFLAVLVVLLILWFLFSDKTKIWKEISDYEARLEPVAANISGFGEAELELKENLGTQQQKTDFEVSVRNLSVDDGTILEIIYQNERVGEFTVEKGRGRFTLSTLDGDTVPDIQPHQDIELYKSGFPVLKGTFIEDR